MGSIIVNIFSFTTFIIIIISISVASQPTSINRHYYQLGFATNNIVSKCDFLTNSCRFRNQHNLATYNRYYNAEKMFFDRHSLLLLNINAPRSQRYPGARLITSYYQAKYHNACLFVSYRYSGPGTLRFFIIQQDIDNKCIFSDDHFKSSISISNENVWNHLELQLDLSDGDVRFFLETHFNSSAKAGYFAIGDFNFGYGNCRNKNENHCYDNIINSHINVAPTAN